MDMAKLTIGSAEYPGTGKRLLTASKSLYPLKDKFTDRFRLNVNTVVCAANYTEIEMLSEFMWKNYKLDGQYFNIVRGETLVGDQIKEVPPNVLPAMYEHVSKLTKRYGDRMFAADDASKRFIKNVAYVGAITTHYRTQHANFQQPTPWPFPCTAGETTAVIDYNGDVRACELREKFATLADYDYDFGALWSAHERETELKVDRRRQRMLVYARLLHSRLDAPFAARTALRVTEELSPARKLVTLDAQTPDGDSQEETNRKSGMAYAAGIHSVRISRRFTGIGWLVDKWFQTTPWFLILGIVLGSAAGLYQFVRISSKTI